MVSFRSKSRGLAVPGCAHSILLVSNRTPMCVFVSFKSIVAVSISSLVIFPNWIYVSTMPLLKFFSLLFQRAVISCPWVSICMSTWWVAGSSVLSYLGVFCDTATLVRRLILYRRSLTGAIFAWLSLIWIIYFPSRVHTSIWGSWRVLLLATLQYTLRHFSSPLGVLVTSTDLGPARIYLVLSTSLLTKEIIVEWWEV